MAGLAAGSLFGPSTSAAVHGLGHGALGLIYSSSFLYAGFIGLGALWLASYVGHGGYTGVLGDDYEYYDYEGYGDPGGYGGYHDYGGGYHRRTRDPQQSQGYPSTTRHKKPHHKDRRNSRWFRKKRAIDEFVDHDFQHDFYGNYHNGNGLQSQNEEEEMVEQLKISDTGNCGMRLVCELSGIRHRALRKEEWDILQFIRSGDVRFNTVRPGQGVTSASKVLGDYRDAAAFGARRGDCRKKYRKCKYSASEMMALIRALKN